MPLCVHLHGHDEGPRAGWLGSLKGLRRDGERQKEGEERDGDEVLMERKESEYKLEIKEKERVNECIKNQTGRQDESLSVGFLAKTPSRSIYMLILQ